MTDWRELLTVPRASFIPSVVWVENPAASGFTAVSREIDEARWHELVAADEPIVTQVDDGTTVPGSTGLRPSSSCSQPSLVAAMLTALDVHDGHRVLEIGTGTGWNAALLSQRAGRSGRVVSVEVDPAVADAARRALADAGYRPSVVTGDGASGYAPGAQYDRVICTASVRTIPRAWLDQTRPGGVIVTPWGTDYGDDALTRLTVRADGSADGRCGTGLAFMRLRQQRRNFLDPTAAEVDAAETTRTTRTGREVFEMVTFTEAAFTIGLRVPSCHFTVEDLDPDHRRVEWHDRWSRSWARLTLVRGASSWTVRQLGPRRLWTEAESAYAWWHEAGRPDPGRYRLTVRPDGTHSVRLEGPHGEHRWSLPR